MNRPARTIPATSRVAALMAQRRAIEGAPAAAPVRRARTAPTAPRPLGDPIIPADSLPLTDILRASRHEPRPVRRGGYLHVSDLIGKCIRRIAIIRQHDIAPAPQKLNLMDLLTFAVGDTIHDVMKERAVIGSPSQVWGNWRCRCGQTKTTEPCLGDAVNPSTCGVCEGPVNVYEEVPMRDEELKIVGTPDLLLFLSEVQAHYITELKSISDKAYDDLTRPKPDHVIQVLFYWYLMQKLGYRLVDQVSILYVTKGYKFVGLPYREFTIQPSINLHRLEPYLDEARSLLSYSAGGKLPPRITCGSDNAPEAKKCDVCSICFGGIDAAPQKVSFAEAFSRSPAPTRRTR